jgi:hypothetical protein
MKVLYSALVVGALAGKSQTFNFNNNLEKSKEKNQLLLLIFD